VCFVWLLEETVTFALYSINKLVFITEVESVYCVVRTESLYRAIKNDCRGFNNLSYTIYLR